MKSASDDFAAGFATEARFRWAGRFDAVTPVDWHTHAETELVAVTAGHCRIQVAGRWLEGGRGALFVLPARVPQYQETHGRTRTTFVGLELRAGYFDESARVLMLDLADPVLPWLEQLCDCHLVRPPVSALVADRLLGTVLQRLAELERTAGVRDRLHPAVRAATAFMEANLTRPLAMAEVARAARVSGSHLGALFAAQCGCSPLHHLQQLRLKRACWLLGNPYLRIHEVATACGYEDVNYFVRLFSRRCGLPPGKWRAQHTGLRRPTGS